MNPSSNEEPQGLPPASRSASPNGLSLIGIITLIMLLPVVPFLVLGSGFETRMNQWLEEQTTPSALAFVGGVLLAADIAVPIPSSSVMTLLGAKLGVLAGGWVGVAGSSMGAIAGFAIARLLGAPFAMRFSREADLTAASSWVHRYGAIVIVLARGLPVIGEATVLAMGLYRMPWSHFVPAVLLANAVLAFTYAAVGDWASQQGWLPVALGIATGLPLVPLLFYRLLSRKSSSA